MSREKTVSTPSSLVAQLPLGITIYAGGDARFEKVSVLLYTMALPSSK